TSTSQNPGNVTFSDAGTYLVSLTAIDSFGNTDPSPPVRKITVLPASPDFSIAVSPPAKQIFPGQSAAFAVTVTGESGFTSPVSLSVGSESGFPTGVTSGGFSPSQITGSGTTTLTMNTTAAAVPYAISLTVTGNSGSLTHTASTTLLVNLAAPASLTATPASPQISLTWPASTGASGYHVKRSTTSGGPYTGIGCATATSFNDSNVVSGTTYYYVVSANFSGGPDAGGESADSSQANATVMVTGPLSPTNLKAAPGGRSGSIKLQWAQSTTPGVTKNNIYRRTASGSYSSTPSASIAASTSYQDRSLTSHATYCYKVTAL